MNHKSKVLTTFAVLGSPEVFSCWKSKVISFMLGNVNKLPFLGNLHGVHNKAGWSSRKIMH